MKSVSGKGKTGENIFNYYRRNDDMEREEQLINEILDLEKEADDIRGEAKAATEEHNEKIKMLINNLENIKEEKVIVSTPFNQKIDRIAMVIVEKMTELKYLMFKTDMKTIKTDTAMAQIKTTKSLKVRDSHRVVEILSRNGMVQEGVKSFNMKLLRRLKDAGVLSIPEVYYDEKKTIYVKLRGDKDARRN